MAVDKKNRLVPGSMYIPPTPPVATAAATSAGSAAATSSATTPTAAASATASTPSSGTTAKSTPSPRLAAANHASPTATLALASTAKALTPNKPLGDLLRSIEPRFCFQPAVEELLLDMASDFVEDVVAFSSRLAKHRRSTELGAKDLQFCLAKNYGISLAGAAPALAASATDPLNPLGADVLVRARPAKNSLHMHRMALKRKTMQRTSAKLKKAGGVKASDAGGAGARKVVQRKNSTAGLAGDVK